MLHLRRKWEIVARKHFGDDHEWVEQLVQLEALAVLGADVLITERKELLALRADPLMSGVPIYEPKDAFVIAGLWSRAQDRAFVHGPVFVNTGLYYWSLARALTPAGWPAYCAFVRGQHTLDGGPSFFDLASSALDRITSAARALDYLTTLSLGSVTNDSNDEILDALVAIVINVWGAYDNMAVLAGTYLNVELDRRDRPKWSVLRKEWLIALESCSDQRAKRIAELVRRQRYWFEVSEQLRHQMLHRARVRSMTFQYSTERQCRVQVEGDVWMQLKAAIRGLGHDQADWGVGVVWKAGTERVTVVGGDIETEAYDIVRGERAFVDPSILAPRLVAHAGRFCNDVFAILDPRSDSRIPKASECDGPPNEFYFSAEGANAAIASSPLAGLVSWSLPVR